MIEIDLERPRDRSSDPFLRLRGEILDTCISPAKLLPESQPNDQLFSVKSTFWFRWLEKQI